MNRRTFFASLVALPFVGHLRTRVIRTRWIKLDAAYWRSVGITPNFQKVDRGGPILNAMIKKPTWPDLASPKALAIQQEERERARRELSWSGGLA